MSRPFEKFVKKARIVCVVLLFAVVVGLYFLRKESYLLNKNVRLVSMRIFEYQELSLHRRLKYRIEFLKDRYRISVLSRLPEGPWDEVKEIRYENSIETTIPGFAFEIDTGRIVSFEQNGDRSSIRRQVVLGFFAPRNPHKQAGILFRKDGTWRALRRYDVAIQGS